MDEDRFDRKIIDIESRSFELSMLMAGFVFDILHQFNGFKATISCEIPYCDQNHGLRIITVNSLSLDNENGTINIGAEGVEQSLPWDDLNLAARESIITEINHVYKSIKLLENFSSKEEIH